MTGRNPRTEKTRDYRREPWTGHLCRARIPLGSKPIERPGPFGFPESITIHCNQQVGVRPVPGGYACPIPGHAEDVTAQSMAVPLRWNVGRRRADLELRAAHELTETTEHYRDAMQDAGRGSLLRG
jgi:hypothetical protein